MRTAVAALFSMISLGALSGCATTVSPSSVENLTKPPIGQVTTRDVGEPLFESGTARTYDGIEFAAGTHIPYPIDSVEPVQPYVLSGVERYCGLARASGAVTTANGQTVEQCVTVNQLKAKGVTYRQGKVTRVDESNFRQQIIYDGRNKNEVPFSYREFRADFARPAFSQELTFDLDESAIVGAKGARIEIINATNTAITYRVLKDFTAQAAG